MINLAKRAYVHPSTPPILSVVIPAWNEEEIIRQTLEEVDDKLSGIRKEVIVVDDGSHDRTPEIVNQWGAAHPELEVTLIRNSSNCGKGNAIKQGVLCSRGEFVSFIDADMDIPPQEIMLLYDEAQRTAADVVVGIKSHMIWKTNGIALPRKIISVSFSMLVKILFRLPVSDTQTGVKIFWGRWIRQTISNLQVNRFLFDLEILVQAKRDGLIILEKPVMLSPSTKPNRISTRHVLQSVQELFSILIRYKTPRLRRPNKAKTPIGM